ncbi:hypothetical protein JCM3770_002012 [Rhodotorula araucariae]
MALCLPPEVVQLVFAAALPSTATISACALVCRAWPTPAQLVLFASPDLDLVRRPAALACLARTLEARPDLAHAVAALAVRANQPRDRPPDPDLARVLLRAHRLRRLFLSHPGHVDLGVVQHATGASPLSPRPPLDTRADTPSLDLCELAIYGGLVVAPRTPPTVLARLTHLSLCGVHLSPSASDSLSTPRSTLPALRVVAHCFSPSPLALAASDPALRVVCTAPPSRPLTPATASTTLLWTRYENDAVADADTAALVLVLLGLADADALGLVRHLRLSDIHARTDDDASDTLCTWVRALAALETLYLPAPLQGALGGGAGAGARAGAFARLCAERAIRVRWEEDGGGYDRASVVPPDWR